MIKFIFFGSSRLSEIVLEELRGAGFTPVHTITNARDPLDIELLKSFNPDVFVVASFGKILSQEVLDIPRRGALNVHPSLLPKLRGPSPIQNTILAGETPAVSIMLMDAQMDHGPILTQEQVEITPWPNHYAVVEEKLARAGGRLLAQVMPKWVAGEVETKVQDESQATYTKMIKTADALLDLEDSAETNLKKVYAYSTEPGAYMMFQKKGGEEIRVKVLDAEVEAGVFTPLRVVPAGKKEMDWADFLRGNQN